MENANDDLKAKLAEAKQRIELANEKRALSERQALEERVNETLQEATDLEALAAAEGEHGKHRIGFVQTKMGMIIMKKAHHLNFKKFQDKDEAKTRDVEELVRPCVVHPSKDRFDKIVEEYPATLTQCGTKIAELAGHNVKQLSSK